MAGPAAGQHRPHRGRAHRRQQVGDVGGVDAVDRGSSGLAEQAIEPGPQGQTAPDQDVYFGVELSVAGIQAMRSSLAGSVPVEVPDLRRPDVRRAYTADDWFPALPEL
jgi:hypothetical protein